MPSCFSNSETDFESSTVKSSSLLVSGLRGHWKSTLQFWALALLLALIGSRVSSLILLEFILRALSTWSAAVSTVGLKSFKRVYLSSYYEAVFCRKKIEGHKYLHC